MKLDATRAIAGQFGSAVIVTTGNGVVDPLGLGLALPDGLALVLGLALVVGLVLGLPLGLAPPVGLALVVGLAVGLSEALTVTVGTRPGLALIVTGDVALGVGAGALAVGVGARLVVGLVDCGRLVPEVVLGPVFPAREVSTGSGNVVGAALEGVVSAMVNGTVSDVPSQGFAVSVTTPFAPVREPPGPPAGPPSPEVSCPPPRRSSRPMAGTASSCVRPNVRPRFPTRGTRRCRARCRGPVGAGTPEARDSAGGVTGGVAGEPGVASALFCPASALSGLEGSGLPCRLTCERVPSQDERRLQDERRRVPC
ncbi:hypothetical protein BCD49_19095 [Pseudofrankia sp. EUN1h]|nr:hypothetical protein BCD49_19095 [Pseudofrankia sp. EUN1h]